MNMGGETLFPSLGEILEALFLYLLIPLAVPLVAGILSARRMPHVRLGLGVGVGTVIGVVTLIAFALFGWFIGFHLLTGILVAWGSPAPYVAPPLAFGAAGAILSWRLICILNDKDAARSVDASFKADG